jgi:S-adenosylmethionine synthetase
MMAGHVRSAEFAFPGHPDKLADAIADALVQEAGRREPRALVGVEVALHRDRVFVTGRIACRDADRIDVEAVVRDVYRSAGFAAGWDPIPERLRVETDLCVGPLELGEAESRSIADDQSICIGYATAMPATNYLPVEQWLANRLGRRASTLRVDRPDLNLGPDGKLLVSVRCRDAVPAVRSVRPHEHRDAISHFGATNRLAWAIEGISCSLQQRASADAIGLHRAVRQALGDELKQLSRELPGLAPTVPEQIHVNGAGAFDIGGPMGDNGLSGKKLVVDAYGPAVAIGGGALSGKDFFKVDRAGALHARRVAKAIVLTGIASEATVTLLWRPGVDAASVVAVDCSPAQELDLAGWNQLFDLSLEASGEAWTNSTDLIDVARFGHFTSGDRPWERRKRSTDSVLK